MASVPPQTMSAGLRASLYIAFGTLWASGGCWLVLHYFFPHATDFGNLPNPWEPVILRVHGWLAVGSVFLLGWITAQHVSERWPRMVKRPSGLSTAGAAVLLVLSGYALYYTTEGLHDVAAAAHEAVGALAIMFALVHWRRYRPRSAVRRSTRQSAT